MTYPDFTAALICEQWGVAEGSRASDAENVRVLGQHVSSGMSFRSRGPTS